MAPPDATPDATPEARGPVRVLWLALGCTCVAVGGVGVVVPGLPTTPFLLLAAASFARSSRALHERLLSHRVFGPLIAEYRERGTIPARAKWLALGLMALGVTYALVWGIPAPLWPAKLAVAAAGLIGLGVVARLPTYRA